MNTDILKNRDFLLGIQQDWDSYYEVTVRFVREMVVSHFTYYLFTEKKTEKLFYLSPNFVGHDIKNVTIEKRIFVKVFVENPKRQKTKQPDLFADGVLLLPDQSLIAKDGSNRA